jgi:outer membrane protein OmpA-like peptidoglycan-associated protein
MKKILNIAFCAAMSLGAFSMAAQEVTYVEDCSQGVLFNKGTDNWFITGQAGANMSFKTNYGKAPFKDRIGAEASLFAGKWISPVFGIRFGLNMELIKAATTENGEYRDYAHGPFSNGYYPYKYYGLGVEVDGLVNMTNWICGYKPGRIYNLVLHGGVGSQWQFNHEMKNGDYKWAFNSGGRELYINVGLQNNFAVSKKVDLFLDLEGRLNDFEQAEYVVNLQAGFTYHIGKKEWNCPVTAVCPTWKYTDAEGDALVSRLAAADGKIRDLQRQLNDCLNRPAVVKEAATNNCDALATVYYPINSSKLGKNEQSVLTSVAQVMKSNPDQKYVLTGWADNYTGTDEINARLRQSRVDGVKNFLEKCGVNSDQLIVTTDNNNLTDFGAQSAPLDRAVTIRENK